MNVKYKIKNNKTGLYFHNWRWERPLTKTGKPCKHGVSILVAKFTEFDKSGYFEIGEVNRVIDSAIKWKISGILDNCELLAYTLQPAKTTLRVSTVRRRLEAKIIMQKLKA